MSLYLVKNNRQIRIETQFENFIVGKDWLRIGCNSKKADEKRCRFSEYDVECNVFRYGGNRFNGIIRIKNSQKHRCRVFQTNKSILGWAKCP